MGEASVADSQECDPNRTSYLSGRTFEVVYGGSTSSTVYIPCSVPQYSVLGPRLFILYTADLEDNVAEHGVSFHAFADDTQLYVHCRHDEVMSAVLRLENCIEEVSDWMSANRLKLNADKTELLWACLLYTSPSPRDS